jgi:hypothetical protein
MLLTLVCIQPGGALCTVESHNELDPTEAMGGSVMGPLSHYALLRAASRSGVEPLVGIGWAVPGLNGATRGHGDAASLVLGHGPWVLVVG